MNLRNLPERVHSIQEIRDIAYRENMPLETMRFFIGRETYERKCYGIYHDYYTEEFVVYKNKADGTHVERYRGKNEEEAAQIIYEKMLEEIRQRIPRNTGSYSGNASGGRTGRKKFLLTRLITIGIICGMCYFLFDAFQAVSGSKNSVHRPGYYVVDDNVYYYQSNHWYYFDEYDDDWYEYYDYSDDWYDCYVDDYYFEDAGDSFYNSSYYDNSYDYDDSWDDDSDDDWDDDDWDDWDWDDSDWDSDW